MHPVDFTRQSGGDLDSWWCDDCTDGGSSRITRASVAARRHTAETGHMTQVTRSVVTTYRSPRGNIRPEYADWVPMGGQ